MLNVLVQRHQRFRFTLVCMYSSAIQIVFTYLLTWYTKQTQPKLPNEVRARQNMQSFSFLNDAHLCCSKLIWRKMQPALTVVFTCRKMRRTNSTRLHYRRCNCMSGRRSWRQTKTPRCRRSWLCTGHVQLIIFIFIHSFIHSYFRVKSSWQNATWSTMNKESNNNSYTGFALCSLVHLVHFKSLFDRRIVVPPNTQVLFWFLRQHRV